LLYYLARNNWKRPQFGRIAETNCDNRFGVFLSSYMLEIDVEIGSIPTAETVANIYPRNSNPSSVLFLISAYVQSNYAINTKKAVS